MNFEILCTSLEAPTVALSDKTNRMKIGQEMWLEAIFVIFGIGFA